MFGIFRRSNSQQQQQQPKPEPRPQVFYNTEQKLRENFAEELLNLEMEIEQPNVSMETVTNLLNLYREAVEYFEAVQSNKYLIFKNKIQTLLTRKNVMQAMKRTTVSVKKEPIIVQNPQEDQQQKELKIKIEYLTQQDQKSSVNTLITDHSEKVHNHSKQQTKVNQMINQELQDQNQVLQKRLLQRRNNSIKKDQMQINTGPILDSAPIVYNPNHTPQIRQTQKAYTARGRTD